MRRDGKVRSGKPVGLRKAENHHTAGWAQPQKMEVREIANQPHGRTVPSCKNITNSIEII
jgi:hypothetical protein